MATPDASDTLTTPFEVRPGAAPPERIPTPLLVVALAAGAELAPPWRTLDEHLGGAIAAALSAGDFRGGRDELLMLTGAGDARRVALLGTGGAPQTPAALRRAGGVAARTAARLGTGSLALVVSGADAAGLEAATVGLHLGAWQWTETRSTAPEAERRRRVASATLTALDGADPAAAIEAGNAIGAGITLARRLGMTPGNICTPDFLAATAREVAARYGMQLTELDRAGLERERMGSFLAVAQGTPQEPRLVALEYRGGAPESAPVVLVGKGLCFDAGGISIKPAAGMEWMKFDMSGAGGVIGAMEAVGRLRLPLNVVGVFGATTNMPSGTAMNPGDVVRSRRGKYIEIINTDAEGRLVLADLLSFVERFRPAAVLDAATLTGACVIALGHTATGVLGTDQSLIDEVLAAGEAAGERAWQLPLWDEYAELMRSDVADVKNSGGRPAGTITAAAFLREFVGDYPWAHLDIAGTAYSESDLGYIPKGPTGVPVGTFVALLRARAAR